MASKFLNLIEATIQKMNNGGILTGDRVELADGYKTCKSFKDLPAAIQDQIEKMFKDSDLNKKVINIKTHYPSTAPGNEDNRGDSFIATVAVELTNGLYDNQNSVAIPMDCLVASTGGADEEFGKAPVPDSVKYKNKVQIEPKEIDEEDKVDGSGTNYQRMTQQGDAMKPSEVNLPTQNTKIPTAAGTKSGQVGNYTSQYM